MSTSERMCQGCRSCHREHPTRIEANREIVLSAGAIGSPQLLMLSGVGPAEHLDEHGIVVKKMPVSARIFGIIYGPPRVSHKRFDHQYRSG